MYLINLTLLYPLVAITDIQKNISEKIHRINQPEYIKFVEKTTILLLVLLCLPFPKLYKKTKGKLFPLDLYIYLKLKTK
jgi:hypothetical protein